MEPETVHSFFSGEVILTLMVCGVSLLAVLVPFGRGLKIALQASAATRSVTSSEIEASLRSESMEGAPSITLQMLHVLQKALRESPREACPAEFVVDASRQFVGNEYDAHYARPVSMCANILPPIGFIGTTGGLFVLFLSMQLGNDSLELGALATALTSSIFALLGFSILEAMKFRLYRRMLDRLDDAISFYRCAENPKKTQERPISMGSPELSPSGA